MVLATFPAAVGTSAGSVKNLQVSDASRRRASSFSSSISTAASPTIITLTDQNLRTAHLRASANAVFLQYSVEVLPSSGVTYEQMSTQLQNSVRFNQFTTLLQTFATAQNVPALTSASSSSTVAA